MKIELLGEPMKVMRPLVFLAIAVLSFTTLASSRYEYRSPASVLIEPSQSKMLKVKSVGEVSVLNEIPKILQSVQQSIPNGMMPGPSKSYVEVASIKEVPGTLIAIFNSAVYMNLALNRASTFIEEGGQILSHQQHLIDAQSSAMGHDLTGPDLAKYAQAYQAAKSKFSNPEGPLDLNFLQVEEDFWNSILHPNLKQDPNLVILAVSIDGDVNGVISHEIIHSQYFKSKTYQEIVKNFWNQSVEQKDKEVIKGALSNEYDVSNENLVINEFQAYILMKNAESSTLGSFVQKYRNPLLSKLRDKGINPLQVEILE